MAFKISIINVPMKPLDKKKKPKADNSHPLSFVLQYATMDKHINPASTKNNPYETL